MKKSVTFISNHVAKAEDLCRCLAIADTFRDSPVGQWKRLLAPNFQGDEAMPMRL